MSLIKRILLVVTVLSILLVGSIFALKNSQHVEIDLLFVQGDLRLSVLIVSVFLGGVLLGFFVALANIFKLVASKKLVERKLRNIEKSTNQNKGNKLPVEI